MTDRTHPDSGRIITSSDILLRDAETALMYEELRAAIDDGHESMTHADALAEIAAIRAENTELRAQLEAIGAGGVSGPLMGIAAPPTAQAEGWRPIKTAPKGEIYRDGQSAYAEYILIWYPGTLAPLRARWWQADSGPNNFLADGGWAVFPTHWMPLPPPPTSAEGVEP